MNRIKEIRKALLDIKDRDGTGRYGLIEIDTIIEAITPYFAQTIEKRMIDVEKLKEAIEDKVCESTRRETVYANDVIMIAHVFEIIDSLAQPVEPKSRFYKKNIDDLVNLLEDVVNALDLSECAFEEHGQMGTEPAELVKLVLDQKDRTIAMLKAGMKEIKAQPVEPPVNDRGFIAHIQSHLQPGDKVICKICGILAEDCIDTTKTEAIEKIIQNYKNANPGYVDENGDHNYNEAVWSDIKIAEAELAEIRRKG